MNGNGIELQEVQVQHPKGKFHLTAGAIALIVTIISNILIGGYLYGRLESRVSDNTGDIKEIKQALSSLEVQTTTILTSQARVEVLLENIKETAEDQKELSIRRFGILESQVEALIATQNPYLQVVPPRNPRRYGEQNGDFN